MHTIFADIYAHNDSSGQCIRLTIPTLWRATAAEKGHWRGHIPVHFLTGLCVCLQGRNATATAPVKMMTQLYYENKLGRKKQRDQRLISQRERDHKEKVYREQGNHTTNTKTTKIRQKGFRQIRDIRDRKQSLCTHHNFAIILAKYSVIYFLLIVIKDQRLSDHKI